MRNHLKYLLTASAAALLALAPAARAEDTIKIGVILPISGGGASTGLGVMEGVKTAVEEVNAAGGVLGKKIEIVLRDEQLRPDAAVAAARELITKEGASAIVGPATSGAALAVSEIAKQEEVPVFVPTARAKSLTDEKLHKYIFQLLSTTDTDAGRMMTVLDQIGTKSICFAGADYAYTTEYFGAMKALIAEKKTIEIGGDFLVKLTETDFNTMISRLMASNCDTIIGTIWGGGFTAFVKQAAPFGLFKDKKLVWGVTIGNPENAAALKGDMPEGLWSHASDLWYYTGSEAHQIFQEKVSKITGKKDNSAWAITGYNSINFLVAAMKKANSSEPKAIAAALEGLSIEGPLGTLTVDPKNHRVNSPEFIGPTVTVPGSDIKQMSPATLVR